MSKEVLSSGAKIFFSEVVFRMWNILVLLQDSSNMGIEEIMFSSFIWCGVFIGLWLSLVTSWSLILKNFVNLFTLLSNWLTVPPYRFLHYYTVHHVVILPASVSVVLHRFWNIG